MRDAKCGGEAGNVWLRESDVVLHVGKPLEVVHRFIETAGQERDDPLGKRGPLLHELPEVVVVDSERRNVRKGAAVG